MRQLHDAGKVGATDMNTWISKTLPLLDRERSFGINANDPNSYAPLVELVGCDVGTTTITHIDDVQIFADTNPVFSFEAPDVAFEMPGTIAGGSTTDQTTTKGVWVQYVEGTFAKSDCDGTDSV